MENQSFDTNWSILQKIAFRFVFLFFLLFIVFVNNGTYPLWGYLMKYPNEWLHHFIPWVGKKILHLSYDITVFTNGSGDTTYDYVILFVILVISLTGTLFWSIVDRRNRNYQMLYYWLTVAIRFYVGLMLINYGLVKVIKLQFSYPGVYRLGQLYGDSSPMGLAWTFLGFSRGYNLFMGIAEVSAVLLLFRRTMTAGAIITLMTTTNVMAVNYFYDVPVKIVSTALVTMTLFLLAHDLERLLKFLFTGQAVALPVIQAPEIERRWLRIAKWIVKGLILGYSLIYGTIQVLGARKQYGDQAPKPPLYGLYQVDLFVKNNDTIPPLMTDTIRWNQLAIQWPGSANIRYMDAHTARYATDVDTVAHELEMTSRSDTTQRYAFQYTLDDSGIFILNGIQQTDTLLIRMTRKNLQEFELVKRSFHWINEYPYNR